MTERVQMNRRTPAARRGKRGFAFVVVLFLLVMIGTAATAFSMRTSGAYRLSRSRAANWQMYYAARGAIEQAKATLWRQFVSAKSAGKMTAAPAPETLQIGEVDVTITYVDETGKFPVNGFTSPDEGKRKELEAVLTRIFEIVAVPNAATLAETVRDYIDKDTDGDRESDALNGEAYEISQLLSAEGFKPEFLYNSFRPERPAAFQLLSTWHTSPINVNSAPPEVLKAFSPRLTDADLRAIIAARSELPFKSPEDVVARAKVSGEGLAQLGKWAGFSTDTLTLMIEARIGGFVKRMEAVVWLESTSAHTLYVREGWQ